jgi:hypothetical protein
LTIFVSPTNFIEATRFMERSDSFIFRIVTEFVKDYCDQPDWFGKTVETTYINLMYGQIISLRLGSWEAIVGEEKMPPFKFGHFMRMVT